MGPQVRVLGSIFSLQMSQALERVLERPKKTHTCLSQLSPGECVGVGALGVPGLHEHS